ncbi:hypothetical protein Tco_0360735 [Tanacetum coccineum]
MDHSTMKALWIYWIRGDDEVELTDEEFFDNKDEIAEVFRIETNILTRDTICSAFTEFNYLLKGALPSDTVKNSKLSDNLTSPVLFARSYPTRDPQCSSHIHNSINAVKTYSNQHNKNYQSKIKTLTINEIGTPRSKKPEQTLEDEFKDLHLNLLVLEVLAHAPMYNAILDKYVKSLKLGKNGSAFIQSEMPKKMKDPKLFTLPCRLGDYESFDTLADLGSCVNLIPLYLN